ncbi:MAG: DUF4956 domain-containing protein [Planctomycetes bacterium]|nr:DUF4956 domain-containing protein [Planctomycetota bacterium]
MFDWLTSSPPGELPGSAADLAVRLLLAVVFGGLVAAVYRFSHGREKHDNTAIMTTLVLLSILIAMVSMVIGNSVARAFSLVGALSIVRFRTVVDDTRDTAYVIFSVIVGMAAGAGLYWVAAVGIPMVAVASVGMSYFRMSPRVETCPCVLLVRLALGRDPATVLAPVLEKHLARQQLTAVATARQGTTLEITYNVQLKPESSMPALVAELNQIDGMIGIELKAIT